MTKKTSTPKKKFSRKNQIIVLGVGLLVLILVVVVALAFNRSKKVAASPTTKPQPTNSVSPSPTPTVKSSPASISTAPTPRSSSTTAPTAASLPAPTGQILNKQEVHLSESNDAAQYGAGMDSTCETVAGATCGFELVSDGGAVKSLPAKAVASSNGLYIVETQWNVKSIGLGVGTWKVHAIASVNGQTAKSADWQLKVVQ